MNSTLSLQPTWDAGGTKKKSKQTKNRPSCCCAKNKSLDNPHMKINREIPVTTTRITNYKYVLTAAHIHGFLRPAWAHFFLLLISSTNYCTKLFLEHSVKGQFHEGRMIRNIYIWLLSHCNIYKEQKAL